MRVMRCFQVITLAGLLSASTADAAERPWRVKVFGTATDATLSAFGQDVEDDAGAGFGLGIERMLSSRFGLELDLLASDLEAELPIDFGIPGLKIDLALPTETALLKLNWHLTPEGRFDLFLGPLLAYERFDALTVSVSTVSGSESTSADLLDDDTAWGAHVGFDLFFGGGNTSLTAGLAYWSLTPRLQNDDGDIVLDEPAELDSLVLSVGVGYRF